MLNNSARLPLTDKPGVLADDPMSEAGRKIMAHYTARMLHHEIEVRNNSSTEAVHDMRVATRRLRSVIRMFEPFYRRKAIRSYAKSLREVAATLGTVRDLEMMIAKVPDQMLQAVTDVWKTEHDQARIDLLAMLDSTDYAQFVNELTVFVGTPYLEARLQSDEPEPYYVRHVAPTMLYQRYSAVRAYEAVLNGASLDTLHTLRIAGKQFRYTLESFVEVLKPEAKTVIDAIKALQEHLGNLQDERVITDRIYEYVQHVQRTNDQQPVAHILQRLIEREETRPKLLSAVMQEWEAFTAPNIRKVLAMAVSAL
jgi:triphosphatase